MMNDVKKLIASGIFIFMVILAYAYFPGHSGGHIMQAYGETSTYQELAQAHLVKSFSSTFSNSSIAISKSI